MKKILMILKLKANLIQDLKLENLIVNLHMSILWTRAPMTKDTWNLAYLSLEITNEEENERETTAKKIFARLEFFFSTFSLAVFPKKIFERETKQSLLEELINLANNWSFTLEKFERFNFNWRFLNITFREYLYYLSSSIWTSGTDYWTSKKKKNIQKMESWPLKCIHKVDDHPIATFWIILDDHIVLKKLNQMIVFHLIDFYDFLKWMMHQKL